MKGIRAFRRFVGVCVLLACPVIAGEAYSLSDLTHNRVSPEEIAKLRLAAAQGILPSSLPGSSTPVSSAQPRQGQPTSKAPFAPPLTSSTAAGAASLSAPANTNIVIQTMPSGAQVWNFKDMDLLSLIKQVGKATGRNFVIDPRVKGKVTFVSNQPLSADEQYQAFLTVLQLQGYATVPNGGVIEIVPDTDAKGLNSPLYANGKARINTEDMVMTIVHLQNVPADEMVRLLNPIANKTSYFAAYAPTNDLIVSDRKRNVDIVIKLVHDLDLNVKDKFEVIHLQYAQADDILKTLNTLFPPGQARPGGSSGVQISFAADPRTRSIVIRGGSADQVQRVRTLLRSLDGPFNSVGNVTDVVYLKQARAQNIAPILNALVQSYLSKGAPQQQQDQSQSSSQSSPRSPTTNLGSSMGQYGSSSTGPGGAANLILNALSGTDFSADSIINGDDSKNKKNTAPSAYIQWEETTNAVIITAPPTLMSVIKEVVTKLDIRRPQILIEVLVAEISTDSAKELGVETSIGGAVQFNTRFVPTLPLSVVGNSGAIATARNDVVAASTTTTPTAAIVGAVGDGLALGYSVNSKLRFLLKAIQNDSKSNILATPDLVTLDNEPAQIKVGKKVPFANGTIQNSAIGGNPVTTFDREDVGLILTIRPQITSDGAIKLVIEQQLSNIVPGTAAANAAGNPTTSERSIHTTVLARNDEILALGGLLQTDVQEINQQVPWLGSIPLIGFLFRDHSKSTSKTNLTIFLHPVILDTDEKPYTRQTAVAVSKNLKDYQLFNTSVAHLPKMNHHGSIVDGYPTLPPIPKHIAPTGQPRYFLQLIGLSDEGRAQDFLAEHQLSKGGRYEHAIRDNKDIYLIFYGDFATLDEARQAAAVLQKRQGLSPIIREKVA
jgi:general secretion pathway protein D